MLVNVIRDCLTGGAIKRAVMYLGLRYPARITDMYLAGEPPEYMAAAVMVVNQSGE